MTLYTLYIKSGIYDINNESLHAFLLSSGYDAKTHTIYDKEQDEHRCEISFTEIKTAQKAETELRKMFYCYLIQEAEFDKTDMTKVRLINLTSFKESGKYYDNFNIEIPADTLEHNLIETILKTHDELPEYFTYHGYDMYDVPFIIPAHTKASDMKPCIKLE